MQCHCSGTDAEHSRMTVRIAVTHSVFSPSLTRLPSAVCSQDRAAAPVGTLLLPRSTAAGRPVPHPCESSPGEGGGGLLQLYGFNIAPFQVIPIFNMQLRRVRLGRAGHMW